MAPPEKLSFLQPRLARSRRVDLCGSDLRLLPTVQGLSTSTLPETSVASASQCRWHDLHNHHRGIVLLHASNLCAHLFFLAFGRLLLHRSEFFVFFGTILFVIYPVCLFIRYPDT